MQTRFKGTYGDRGQTAIAFAMNDEFQHEIRRMMVGLHVGRARRQATGTHERSNDAAVQDYYNANPDADSLTRVQQQLDDVKDVMVENIGAPLSVVGGLSAADD